MSTAGLYLLYKVLTLPCTFAARTKMNCGSCLLLPLLILLHLTTYATHLLLAERAAHLSEFNYLVIKYGLGQSFIIFVPFTMIACKSDLRDGVVTTFSSAVLCPVHKRR